MVVEEGREPREVESPYAEQVRSRERQIRRRTAWKTQGTGAQFMTGGRAVLWGQEQDELPPAQVVGATRGREAGEVVYALSTGVVTGLFAQLVDAGQEQRILHDAELRLMDVALSVEDEAVAVSVDGKGGSSSIGILRDDAKGVRTVTDGDVLDRAPRWVPGGVGQIVYASAGIGRDASGTWSGLAPFAVQRLSLAAQELDVVVSDPRFDYIAPVPASADVVYAIRRPYVDPHAPAPFFRVVADALLFPFRLLFAVFGFLSFFTARYTGKPLLTSGNARQKAADARQMSVWGNLVTLREDAKREAESEARGTGSRGYELVRITREGVESMARDVLAFDVAPDGAIFYSDGARIARLADGKSETIAKLAGVSQLVIFAS
jgi:hypothetical protein